MKLIINHTLEINPVSSDYFFTESDMNLIMSLQIYPKPSALFFEVAINISLTTADCLLQNVGFLTFNLSPKAISSIISIFS